MTRLKKIGVIILLISGLNIITYFIFGWNNQFISIISNESIYELNKFDALNIVLISNRKNNHNSNKILKYFKEKGCALPTILFAKKINIKKQKRKYNYYVIVNSNNPFYTKVTEIVHVDNEVLPFYQTWKSSYVWFFYKWVLIKKEQTGIS